jgi:general secretion pathway protein K
MRTERGGALLAVMWLAAALAAIAFSVASRVRAEIDRASTLADGTRAYYLAAGAVDRALLQMLWGAVTREPAVRFAFPSGEAIVEIVPETSRLSLNQATVEDLARLAIAAGAPPAQAQEIAAAIHDWRTPSTGGFSPFDRYYLTLTPSFRARHASFEQVEELLLVKGMTPELFYGAYRDGGDRMVPFGGLRDCVSVFGTTGQFDVNTAAPALLASIGVPPDTVRQIVETRRRQPFRNDEEVDALRQIAGPAGARLRLGGNSIFTLRATARLRLADGKLSDLRSTVAATVKLWRGENNLPYQVLRWHEGIAAEPAL